MLFYYSVIFHKIFNMRFTHRTKRLLRIVLLVFLLYILGIMNYLAERLSTPSIISDNAGKKSSPPSNEANYTSEKNNTFKGSESLMQSSSMSYCSYKNCPSTKPGLINVHIVPYTHLDLGWEATVDEYFVGVVHPNDNRYVSISEIIDGVIKELLMDPSRRFSFSEVGFFWRWWKNQDEEMKKTVRDLISSGRLEFINGGWGENDAVVTLYGDIIDQMTLGLTFLNETFGECGGIPRIASNVDSFGTSREQPLLNALMGFDGLFNGRLDYLEKAYRYANQKTHFIWTGSNSLGTGGDTFTAHHYHVNFPPNGFCFEDNCPGNPPVVINEDKSSLGYNVEERVDTFLKDCQYQADSSGLDHILYSMGGDLAYQNATGWYDGMDKIIRLANKRQSNGSRFHLFYSAPRCFFKALHAMDRSWPVKTDDVLPYGFDAYMYWTGFYTSRPSMKYMARQGSNLFQSCKQMASVLAMKGVKNPGNLFLTKDAMAIMQHHDAITGTQFNNVTEYFIRILHDGLEECKTTLRAYYENELPIGTMKFKPVATFCQLNMSQCHVTEKNSRFVVNVYNGLARHIDKYIRLPVSDGSVRYRVYDPKKTELKTQLVPIADFVLSLPGRVSTATHELVFLAKKLPPMGSRSYYVELLALDENDELEESSVKEQFFISKRKSDADFYISNEKVKIAFNGTSGLTKSISVNGGVPQALKQEFLWYPSASTDVVEKRTHWGSGAYTFNPAEKVPLTIEGDGINITIYKGELVEEVHQVYNDWVGQVIRLYKGQSHVELDWVVGPISFEYDEGREIISSFTSKLKSNATFYVDANGRQTVKRVRDYRESFNYTDTTEPIAHNYYPVNSHIYLKDEKGTRFTVLVDRAQGGSSLLDGQLELMVHRRLANSDFFPEILNETAYGRGLVARGTHWLVLNGGGEGFKLIRSLGQEMYRSPLITFVPTELTVHQWITNYKSVVKLLSRVLPENINLLSFEPRSDGKYLLRLEHIYEIGDDPVLSLPVVVSLNGLFEGFKVTSIEELTLGANVFKKDSKPLKWKREGEQGGTHSSPIDSQPVATVDSIELQPMQIRTFVATLEANEL